MANQDDQSVLQGELVPTGAIQPTRTEIVVTIPEQKVQQALALAGQTDFVLAQGTTLVTFGNAPITALSGRLNELLDAVTKADNPVLFELFREVSTAVDTLDMPGLEADIQKRLSVPWWARGLMFLKLMKYADWLQRANKEVLGILEGRTKSLLDLITPMEIKVASESQLLVTEIGKMGQHASAYRATATDVGMYVLAGRAILDTATSIVEAREQEENPDPMRAQDTIDLRAKLDMFAARVVALETAYAKAPANVNAIQLAQGAGLLTLADTVSSAPEEFNDIKSDLLLVHATYRITSLQNLNAARRQLRARLSSYMLDRLETSAITAASSLVDARLESAKILATVANRLVVIGTKLATEREKGKEKLVEAKAALADAQQNLSQLAHPSA